MDDFKAVTENLYKQNVEIALKNRTLSLLSKLYEISLQTLTPEKLAEKMGDVIRTTLDFELVGIFLFNSDDDTLSPLGVALSERLYEAEAKYTYFIERTSMRSISKSPFFKPILQGREMNCNMNLGEIFQIGASEETLNKIKTEGHVRCTTAYPLIVRENVIGVLFLGMNRRYEELSDHEKESIENLINVVAVALDKALLYLELRKTNDELAESNSRQESLIHFISHEIKGFLTKNLAIFAAIKEGDYGSITPELTNAAEYGLTDTKKGVETVLDILNASNLKKGTMTFKMHVFDLRQSLREITDNLRQEATAKGLTLTFESSSDSFEDFKGDKEQLEKHVFRNLIDNAIKYTPTGEIKIMLKKQDGKILFSVKDSGVGITAEDKKRLFTEGGRGSESTLVNVNSTGYGLFIAKQIITIHNGRIWAESEGKGMGSTFYVEF